MLGAAAFMGALGVAAGVHVRAGVPYGAAQDCGACPSCTCFDLYEGGGGAETKAVLFLHGGLWYSGTRGVGDALCRELVAGHRVACASADYVFSQDLGGCCTNSTCPATAARQADEVVSAYAAVKARMPHVRDVYIAGHSAGGHLALLLSVSWARRARGLPVPAGFIGVEGIYDAAMWSDYDARRFGGAFACVTQQAFGPEASRLSPAALVATRPPLAPTFVIHSPQDTYVQAAQAREMHDGARQWGGGHAIDVEGRCAAGEHDATLQGASAVKLAACLAEFMA